MRKFEDLTPDERYKLGQEMGGKLLGTCSYPEHEIEAFLIARDIDPETADPTMDSQFCNGLDDTAMCCDSCNWYTSPDDLNEWSNCSSCQEYDDGYGEEE